MFPRIRPPSPSPGRRQPSPGRRQPSPHPEGGRTPSQVGPEEFSLIATAATGREGGATVWEIFPATTALPSTPAPRPHATGLATLLSITLIGNRSSFTAFSVDDQSPISYTIVSKSYRTFCSAENQYVLACFSLWLYFVLLKFVSFYYFSAFLSGISYILNSNTFVFAQYFSWYYLFAHFSWQ